MLPATITFVNQTRNRVLASEIKLAGTSSERRKGLLGVKSFNDMNGLWIVPCEAIHTFGMQTRLDALFLDKALKIVSLRQRLRSFRIAVCLRAHSVLELAPGAIAHSGTRVGDQLERRTNL